MLHYIQVPNSKTEKRREIKNSARAGVAVVSIFSSKDQRSGGRPHNMSALGRHYKTVPTEFLK